MKIKFLLTALLILLAGCGNQPETPKIPGVTGPLFNVQNGKVIVSFELHEFNIDAGLSFPIPKLDHSEMNIGPRLEGGSIIQLVFDPKDVESDEFKVTDPNTLPGGRPFPFTAGGTLPALAIQTPDFFNTTFYASDKLFGFFIPFNHSIDFDIAHRIKMNDKNIGIISLMKEDSNQLNSGFLLLFTLKDITQNPQFQNLIKYSKKHQNRRF
jgi:hypothetical protein